MNYKPSYSKDSTDTISDNNSNEIIQDTTSYNNAKDSKFTIRKADGNNNTIFEKDADDVNEIVAECRKCDGADQSAIPPYFENDTEGAKKASIWLTSGNTKYNFNITCNEDINIKSRASIISAVSTNQRDKDNKTEIDS